MDERLREFTRVWQKKNLRVHGGQGAVALVVGGKGDGLRGTACVLVQVVIIIYYLLEIRKGMVAGEEG